MISSTNLNDLPITSSLPPQQHGENVLIENNNSIATQQQLQYQAPQPEAKPVLLDPNTINQIVRELHQATLAGVTKLQPRDIPQEIILPPIVEQQQIQPLPTPSSAITPAASMIASLDYCFTEFQIPIALGMLFFLFQLLTSNYRLRKYLSFLYLDNGTLRREGNILMSGLFAGVFYFFQKYCYP
jgi:hypothetical protein